LYDRGASGDDQAAGKEANNISGHRTFPPDEVRGSVSFIQKIVCARFDLFAANTKYFAKSRISRDFANSRSLAQIFT